MSTFVIFIDLPRHFMGCTFAQRQVSKIGNFFQVWNLFFGVINPPLATLANTITQLFAIDLLSHSCIFIWDNHGLRQISPVNVIPEASKNLRCTKKCSRSKNRLKPYQATKNHVWACLNRAETRHMLMYIHTIPYQSIQVHKQLNIIL